MPSYITDKKVLNHQMKPGEIALLAYQTCEYWNAAIFYGKHYIDCFLDNNDDTDPWDGNAEFFPTIDKMNLISAIHHAIEGIEKLSVETEDSSLQAVLTAIYSVAPMEDIRNLRNMNEHGLSYQLGVGRHQDEYCSTVENNGYTIHTNARWTILHGDAKLFIVGNVRIDLLLLTMKDQLPAVHEKTTEIFIQAFSSIHDS